MNKTPMFASGKTNNGPLEEYKQNISDLNKQLVTNNFGGPFYEDYLFLYRDCIDGWAHFLLGHG